MRTEVPAVVSKLETCEQETGWADFISIEISKKALFCRPTLFRNEFRELLIRANTRLYYLRVRALVSWPAVLS